MSPLFNHALVKGIYEEALATKFRRIQQCGKALRQVTDEHSLVYWNQELKHAQQEYILIQKRIKSST